MKKKKGKWFTCQPCFLVRFSKEMIIDAVSVQVLFSEVPLERINQELIYWILKKKFVSNQPSSCNFIHSFVLLESSCWRSRIEASASWYFLFMSFLFFCLVRRKSYSKKGCTCSLSNSDLYNVTWFSSEDILDFSKTISEFILESCSKIL